MRKVLVKARKESAAEEPKVISPTDREAYALRWAARRSYFEIKDYFIEDCNDQLVQNYMCVVCLLNKECEDHALYLVATLLEQAYSYELMNFVMNMCDPDDGSIDIFINALLDTAFEDLAEDEDDEYDDEPEEDIDEEEPFSVVNISIDGEHIPGFEEAVEHVLKIIGITADDLKKKEADESE